jgi:hypothetical protein
MTNGGGIPYLKKDHANQPTVADQPPDLRSTEKEIDDYVDGGRAVPLNDDPHSHTVAAQAPSAKR